MGMTLEMTLGVWEVEVSLVEVEEAATRWVGEDSRRRGRRGEEEVIHMMAMLLTTKRAVALVMTL
jgi:hypothetical protein